MDMTLREILEKYVAVFNPECCFYWGVFKSKDIEEVYQKYNIEKDYPEAFCPENLVNGELLDCDQFGDMDKLERIMYDLGISKKEEDSNEL